MTDLELDILYKLLLKLQDKTTVTECLDSCEYCESHNSCVAFITLFRLIKSLKDEYSADF